MPIGTIISFAGQNTNIANFLLCDGTQVLISEYRDLYNIIGLHYGASPSKDYFYLPDLRNRRPWMDGTLGQMGGQNAITLTENQIPYHSHNFGSFISTHSHPLYSNAFVSGASGNVSSPINTTGIQGVTQYDSFNIIGPLYTSYNNANLSGSSGINTTNSEEVNLQNPFLKMYYYIRY